MLTRFDAMDTKMEYLATAIKSGETTQNRTILQIQHQLETVCSSLHLLVQQIGIQQPTRPLQLSQVEPLTQNLPANHDQAPQQTGSPHTALSKNSTANDSTHNLEVDTIAPRSRSPAAGNSPEKKKQRSSTTFNHYDLASPNHTTEANPGNFLHDDDKDTNATTTDQSGAQYNRPSPSDGGQPD